MRGLIYNLCIEFFFLASPKRHETMLDLTTILLTYWVTSALMGVLLSFVWLQNRRRFPEISFWFGGYLLHLLALCFVSLNAALPELLTTIAANLLALLGAWVIYLGLARFVGKPAQVVPGLVTVLLAPVLLYYFLVGQENTPARHFVSAISATIVTTQCADLLLRQARRELKPVVFPAGVVFAFYALTSLYRAALVVLNVFAPALGMAQPQLEPPLVFFVYDLATIVLVFSMQMMVSRRLQLDVQAQETARLQAEAKIRESEERLKHAASAAQIGVWDWDVTRNELRWDDSMYQLYGIQREDFSGVYDAWVRCLHPDDAQKMDEEIQAALRGEKEFAPEFRVVWPNGSVHYIQAASQIARSIDGKPQRMIGTNMDITERKLAEEALRDNEAKLRMMFDTMSEGLALNEIVYDENGEMVDYRILDVNPAFYQLADYNGSDVIGNLASKLYDMTPELIRGFWLRHKELNQVQHAEMLSPRSHRYYYISTSPFVGDKFVTSFIDITNRKQMEEKLRESEAHYRALFEHLPIPVFIKNREGVYTSSNPENQRYWMTNPLGYTDVELLPPQEAAALRAADLQVMESGKMLTLEEGLINTPMGQRSVLSRKVPLYDSHGAVVGVLGASVDITERKQVEEALRAATAQLETLINVSPLAIMILDCEGCVRLWNPAAEIFFGWSAEEVIGHKNPIVPPDRMTEYAEWSAKIMGEGQTITNMETTRQRKDGSSIDVNISSAPFYGAGGESLGRMAIFTDITERKRAEEALRESEFFFKESQRAGNIGSYKCDFRVGGRWESSEVLDKIFGIGPGYDRSIPGWLGLIHPEDRDEMEHYLRQNVITLHQPFNKEYRIVRQNDGLTRWVLGLGEVRYDENGNTTLLIGTIQDTTERREAESALRKSEARMVSAIQITGICLYEEEGDSKEKRTMTLLDDRMRALLGIPREQEYRARSYWIEHIHPDDMQGVMLSAMNRFENQGENIVAAEYRYQNEQRGWIWLRHVAYALHRNEAGDVLRLVGAVQDITERKQAEEQIKKALAEKETLLRELYHRTKNNMGVIIALLGLQATYFDDQRLQKVFDETQNRIRSMALVHQKLYEAQDLSHINLKDYIHDLVKLAMESYALPQGQVSVISEMEDVFVLIDIAIPCGLILNEVISNALKYAFPGGQIGVIEIYLHRLENNEIQLHIQDNGVGFPAGFDIRRDGHMGIQTVLALSESQLHAKIGFSSPGQGGVSYKLQFKDNIYHPRV